MPNTSTLEEQIETLKSLGFRFRPSPIDHPSIMSSEWWEYLDPPYTLLMQRIIFATGWSGDICEGVFVPHLKHLRYEGWYEAVGKNLAKISSVDFRVIDIETDEAKNHWQMKYQIGKESHDLISNYPHKYASYVPILEMLPSFATEKMCFYAYEDPGEQFDGPNLFWLPSSSKSGLKAIFGDYIESFEN